MLLILFTAEDRNLMTLNATLLQNKHPDHIREKSIELKPHLQKALEERGESTAWLDSIK